MRMKCGFADSHTRWEDHGLMTKEEEAYASTLNLIGSDVLDPSPGSTGWELADALGRERRLAAHSTGPHVDCPHCYWTTPYCGPADNEHFADLWDHLVARHGCDARYADEPARVAWARPVLEFEGATAA
jgi:hypothetical protein